jgi:multidrug transporter EmrE-like cation transporter
MTPSYLALMFSILAGVGGQLFLKASADRSTGSSIIAQLFMPLSIMGLALYFVAALAYMYALRKIPVSIAFPTGALSYPLVAVLAFWIAGEPLAMNKLIGIGLVIAGVALIHRVG